MQDKIKLRLISLFKIGLLLLATPFILVLAPFYHLMYLPLVDAFKRFKREFKNALKCYNLIDYIRASIDFWNYPTIELKAKHYEELRRAKLENFKNNKRSK